MWVQNLINYLYWNWLAGLVFLLFVFILLMMFIVSIVLILRVIFYVRNKKEDPIKAVTPWFVSNKIKQDNIRKIEEFG